MKYPRLVVVAVALLAACAVEDEAPLEADLEDDVLSVQIGDVLVEESEFDAYGIEVIEAEDGTAFAEGELTAQPQTAEWSQCQSRFIAGHCGTQSQLKWLADNICRIHFPGSKPVIISYGDFCGISRWARLNYRCCK